MRKVIEWLTAFALLVAYSAIIVAIGHATGAIR